METRRYTLYDNTEWYFEKALAAYLCGEQKREDSLTAEDYRIISECAGNHIAFFLTWVVKHHYESDLFASVSGGAEALEALRSESMTGAEFLLTHCDGKLDGEMLCEEILPFVDHFYQKFYFRRHYVHWVMTVLHDLPLEFRWSWEDYYSFAKVIDQRYKVFVNNQKAWRKLEQSQNT